MVLTYFLNDFKIIPVAPIITGITLGFTFHIGYIIIIIIIIIIFSGSAAQRGLLHPRSTRFLDHTEQRATVGRTPLDE
jgi:hypothetical protein